MTDLSKAAAFWDRETEHPTHVTWMEPTVIRDYINTWIAGVPETWTFEWFEQEFAPRLPIPRALSIGCGAGILERVLVQRKIVSTIDAFDGSVASLVEATRAAERERLGGIRYFAADFNEPALPRATYDAVFFHQSAHHVAHLERLFRAVLRAMKPGAILLLDEYVGPSRNDWNDERIAPHRRLFASIPRALRRSDDLPLPIQMDDPSEAVRSSEILPQMRIGFDVITERGYGGNLLSVLFPRIVPDDELIVRLIDEERQMLAAGDPHYHAVVVARPKRGIRRAAAIARYWLEPKLRGLRFALLTRLGRKDVRW